MYHFELNPLNFDYVKILYEYFYIIYSNNAKKRFTKINIESIVITITKTGISINNFVLSIQ